MSITPPRLVDMAVEWPLQYAGESTLIDPSAYPGVRDRLGQLDGYLSATAIALVWFGPAPGDRPDPWPEVSSLLAGIEAEFSGRLLAKADDRARLDAEPPDALTWAVAGLRGVSDLLRSGDGPGRLTSLIDRGVRAVRLAGLVDRPAPIGDDAGLSVADRGAIDVLVAVARVPLLLDLAGLGPKAAGEAIDRVEGLGGLLVPVVSLCGGEGTGGVMAGLQAGDLDRLWSLGGVVGLGAGRAFHPDAEAIARSVVALSARPGGAEGVAVGTGFPAVEAVGDGLATAPDLFDAIASRFDAEAAGRLASGNATRTIARLFG